MRFAAIFFLACSTLFADVAILKDGRKISGKIVDKNSHY